MEKKTYTPIIPELTKNAITVLERRYLKRDKEGKVLETPVQMFRRVADTIAAADQKFDEKADTDSVAEEFYRMMTQSGISAQFADLDECRTGTGTAFRLFCPAGRRLHGRNF